MYRVDCRSIGGTFNSHIFTTSKLTDALAAIQTDMEEDAAEDMAGKFVYEIQEWEE